MPRKKEIKSGFHLKFIPSGRMDVLVELANNLEFIKDKDVALCKYVEALSAIVEKSYFYKSKKKQKFFAVSQKMLSQKLGVNSITVSRILKDLVNKKFLKLNAKDFQSGSVSYKYQPIIKTHVEAIVFFRQSLNKKTDEMFSHEISNKDFYLTQELNCYRNSIVKLTFDSSIEQFINSEYKELCRKDIEMLQDVDVRNKETDILCNSIQIFNILSKNISTIDIVPNYNSLVPDKSIQYDSNSLVPNQKLYQSLGILRPEFIPVINLLLERYKVSRPIKDSRVYSNITNLKKCFRTFLRLNGKPLVGFDIANSQPLLATIEFQKFSMEKYGYIKPDILEYQKICEEGKFYEYFTSLPELEEIDIQNDEELRSQFKGTFFGKIFYSKNIEQENFLKMKFQEKYATCYEAIFFLKGDKNYSQEYKKFPALMTKHETAIMWNTNLEVINQGYDMVNIFDSLYSDDEMAVALAKHLVLEKFKEFGITPTLKEIDYRTEPKPIEILANADLQQEIIKEPIQHSTVKNDPVNRQEIKKPVERFITEEAKDLAINELEYFETYWAEKVGLELAYEMYEGQFKKLEKMGIHLKPKNLLKAV